MQNPSMARRAVMLGIIAATTCTLPVRADTLETIRERGTLIWGADAEGGGPFVFPRDDDPTAYTGFEYELAQLLADKLGVKAQFAQGQWDKLPDLAKRGDIDIVLNGYEWTPIMFLSLLGSLSLSHCPV